VVPKPSDPETGRRAARAHRGRIAFLAYMRVQRTCAARFARTRSPLTQPLRGGNLLLHVVILLALSVPACRSGPTLNQFRSKLAETAGPGAADCGMVMLESSKSDAVTCSAAALAACKPFYVAFQVQGIDSAIVHGLAVNAKGEATRLMWDSDKHGGRYPNTAESWIDQKPCESPSVTYSHTPIACRRPAA
jgi:hypothetical protein